MEIDKNCGIYKITSPTGKIYIGQAVNISRRWSSYGYKSNRQPRLQRSFLKHKIENHQFDVIEYCSEEELNCSERFWQDEFDATGAEGLNCSLTQCGEKRYKHSEETRQKMSLSAMGENNPNWGKPMSEEAKEKRRMSHKSRKGVLLSDETKQNMKDNHADFKRGNHPQSKRVLDTQTEEIFECIADAADTVGISRGLLSDWLLHPHRNKTNFKYLDNV